MYKIFLRVRIFELTFVIFWNVFVLDIEIARNGIYITRDMADKALGDGFVAFVNMDNAFKAIDMHDQKHIQHRFDWTWSFDKNAKELAAPAAEGLINGI
jgi:hypothetical protein